MFQGRVSEITIAGYVSVSRLALLVYGKNVENRMHQMRHFVILVALNISSKVFRDLGVSMREMFVVFVGQIVFGLPPLNGIPGDVVLIWGTSTGRTSRIHEAVSF